jgi:hypothetical protein
LGCQWNDCSRLWNREIQISPWLQSCLHCRRCPTRITMQMIRVPIRWSRVVQKANPKSVWSKPNYPWSNLWKWCSRPTIVCSTSGRKYGWLGFWS